MKRAKFQTIFIGTMAIALSASMLLGSVTNDREYNMGDDDNSPSINDPVGVNTSGRTYDNEFTEGTNFFDAQDFKRITGAPTYQAGHDAGSLLSIRFNGTSDAITAVTVDSGTGEDVSWAFNNPNWYWNQNAFGNNPGYPLNYATLDNRGTQLWVKPTDVNGTRQDILLDSSEFGGVVITENNKWGMAWDMDDVIFILETDGIFESGADVQQDTWTHVMQVSLSGTTNGVLFINGVAVVSSLGVDPAGAVRNFGYDTGPKNEDRTETLDPEPLFIGGSDLDGDGTYENFFKGDVDDVTMFLWGDNSGQVGPPEGQDWGTFNLLTDNEYVAQQITASAGIGDINLDGSLNQADVDALLANWMTNVAKELVGLSVGDFETYQLGDINTDGLVNSFDWMLLRRAFIDDGQAAPSFSDVPEPATLALLGLGGLATLRRRRQSKRENKMSNLKSIPLFGIVLVALALSVSTASANTISINIWDTSAGDADNNNVDPGEKAGLIRIDGQFWNNVGFSTGNTDHSLTQGVIDSAGANAGTFTSTLTSGYVNFSGAVNTTTKDGDRDMMTSYLSWNAGDAGDPITKNLAITGLGTEFTANPGGYNVYIYSDSNSNARTYNITIDGQTLSVVDNATYDGSFNEGGSGTNENYIVFKGLTVADFTIDMLPSAGRGAINGIQITTDEPSDKNPILQINRETGNLTLLNNTGEDILFPHYAITSAIGALDQSNWTSIADNYDADNDQSVDNDDTWETFTLPGVDTDLSEGTLGEGTLANGGSIDLGNAWIQSPTEDLAILLFNADDSQRQVDVRFVGNNDSAFAVGDLDFNGLLEAADYLILAANFDSDLTGLSSIQAYGLGDLDDNGAVDRFDFAQFKFLFDQANGAGAFDTMVASVPEPATLALLGLGSLVAMRRRRKVCQSTTPRRNETMSKANVFVTLIAVALFGLVTSTQASELAHYDLDETFSAIIVDSSGNGNDATIVNPANINLTVPGISSTGVTATANGYIAAPALFTGDMARSVSLWFNPNTLGQTQNRFVEIGRGAAGQSWDITFEVSTNNPNNPTDDHIMLRYGNGNFGWSGLTEFGGFETDTWYHMVMTYDGGGHDTNTVKLYVDGQLMALDGGNQNNAGQILITGQDSNVFAISNMSALNLPFDGEMDEVRIFDHALTAQEVTDLFVVPVPEALTLEVNTTTGAATLKNDSGSPMDFDYYEITSTSGSLAGANWNSLEDQDQAGFPADDGSGNGWKELGTPTQTQVAEGVLTGSSTITDQDSLNLGNIFDVNGAEDVQLTFGLPGGKFYAGDVVYVQGGVILGDVNGDGLVNGFDVDPFVDVLLNGPYQVEADVNEDGAVNGFDVDPFVALVLGGGSAPDGTQVPEPATLALLAFGGLAVLRRKK